MKPSKAEIAIALIIFYLVSVSSALAIGFEWGYGKQRAAEMKIYNQQLSDWEVKYTQWKKGKENGPR